MEADKGWCGGGEGPPTEQKFMRPPHPHRANRIFGCPDGGDEEAIRKQAHPRSDSQGSRGEPPQGEPAKEQSAKYHPYYQGKIEIVPRVPVRSFNDFAIWYTPGVAQPCLDIKADPQKVWSLTNKWNQVAVVTDGTRVLGLGDIGPEAGLPVMEGKCLLFKYLGGVDAFPVPLATKDPEKIIETVKLITPSFGGVNLEDIAQPKCFRILQRLRKECDIAVWHDDQQGTATINVAGVINALKVVGDRKSTRLNS